MWLATEKRLYLYNFLAGIFNTIPTKDLVEQFIDGIETWKEFGKNITQGAAKLKEPISLITSYLDENSQRDFEKIAVELGVDRTRLVGGISKEYGPPPPYESVYRDGEILMGPSTKMVWQKYKKSGIYHGWKMADNPPDYLGLELEYMYFLCQAQLYDENTEENVNYITYQKNFLEQHLGKWVPAYCQEIRRWAKTDFFKGIGLLLEIMIFGDLKAHK